MKEKETTPVYVTHVVHVKPVTSGVTWLVAGFFILAGLLALSGWIADSLGLLK